MERTKLVILNIFCAILIGWFAIATTGRTFSLVSVFQTDFSTFYTSLQNNNDIYKTTVYTQESNIQKTDGRFSINSSSFKTSVNLNTPLMNLFLKPLINFSNNAHNVVMAWTLISLLGAAIGIGILLPYFSSSKKRLYFFIPILLLLLLSHPGMSVFYISQISFLIFPVLCIAYALCREKQERSLAVVLGLLAALKIFFLVFILYYLVKRDWKLLFYFAIAFLFFFFLPAVYFSFKIYPAFFHLTQDNFTFIGRSALAKNGSLLGFVANLFYFVFPQASIFQLAVFAYLLSIYVVIRSIIYDYRTLSHLPAFSNELRFSFYIMLALLCSPLAWIYYFVFLIVPAAVFFQINQRYQLGKTFNLIFCLAIILPFFTMFIFPSTLDIRFFVVVRQFSLFTDLLCWLICLLLAVNAIQEEKIITLAEQEKNHRTLKIITMSGVIIPAMGLFFIWGSYYFLTFNRPEKIENDKILIINFNPANESNHSPLHTTST